MLKTYKTQRKIALHIGVNNCSPDYYSGWRGELEGPENDARALARLSVNAGYSEHKLLTTEATRAAVISAFQSFASVLEPGDHFLFSYAGHGNHHRDMSGEEADNCDETLCLFDGELFDDELGGLLTDFEMGVNILGFLDCCHSGTMTRDHSQLFSTSSNVLLYDRSGRINRSDTPIESSAVAREMPEGLRSMVWESNKASNQLIRLSELANVKTDVKANVTIFSGCDDSQKSIEEKGRGLFSLAIENVWNSGHFDGTYSDFYSRLLDSFPDSQTPQASFVGLENPFSNETPFRF
ncbi:MAG: caspase family protein [Pseudomonadales bacterium]